MGKTQVLFVFGIPSRSLRNGISIYSKSFKRRLFVFPSIFFTPLAI